MSQPPPILCIAGPQPSVGKTTVAAGLIRQAVALGGHPVGVAPLSTACDYGEDHDLVSTDGEVLREAGGTPIPPLVAAPYRFASPLTPLLATRRAGLTLNIRQLADSVHAAADHGDVVFVELPDGARAPIAEDGTGLDLAARLDAWLLLVDVPSDGVVSRLLALLECAKNRSVMLSGVLLNARPPAPEADPDLSRLLAEQGRVRVFPSIPPLEKAPVDGVTAHLTEHHILEQAFRRGEPTP